MPRADELETEFRDLLVWVYESALKVKKNNITAEEIGREILNYPGESVARGITYGSIWGALVRAASIYRRADAAFVTRKATAISVGKRA